MREARAVRVRSWVQIATAYMLIFTATSTWGDLSTDEAKQHDLIRAVSKGAGKAVKELKYDSSIVEDLETEANKGDAHAQRLLADALANGKDEVLAQDRARALGLYQSAAAAGLSGGFIGQAEIILSNIEDFGIDEGAEALNGLLSEASTRGVARADRLLAKRISQFSMDLSVLEEGWQLLNRSAKRGDPYAQLEVGNALLEGSWSSLPVEKDAAAAEEQFLEAMKQGVPEAALRLSQLIMREYLEDGSVEKELAAKYLFFAYRWAHQKSPKLIEEMDRMGATSELQPSVWVRSRGLYEKSLEPRESVGTGNILPFTGKIQHGKMTYLKIEGAASTIEPTYSLLGFPSDAHYLWDGIPASVASQAVSVDPNDEYWERAVIRSKDVFSSCFLKVLDGPYSGLVVTVPEKWTPGEDRSIALAEDVSEILKGNETVALGYWRTLFSLFGEYNELGLKPGINGEDADQIILLNAQFQTTERYFFNRELMGWSSVSKPKEVVEDIVIPPWQGIVVLRRDPAPLYLKVNGVLNDTTASVPIDPGINLLSNVQYKFLVEDLESSVSEAGSVAASTIQIYELKNNQDNGYELLLKKEPDPWWESLGIQADDAIYVNRGTVFIVSENPESQPYLLQL